MWHLRDDSVVHCWNVGEEMKKRLKKPKDRKLDITTLKYVRDMILWYAQNCDDYAASSLKRRGFTEQFKRLDAGGLMAQAAHDLEIAEDMDELIYEQRRNWKDE